MFNLKNTRYMQYVATISATLSITSGTMYASWPSPTLPILLSSESPVGKITAEEASWIVSAFLLAGLPGAPLIAYLIDKIGRKWTIEIGALLLFFPWFLIIFPSHVWMLQVARMCGGFGYITVIICCSIYIGEISDKDIRGKLGSTFTLMKLIGTITMLGVGPFLSYRVLGLICLIFPAAFIITFYFMPESPYYLIKVGRIEEAKKVLKLLSAADTEEGVINKKFLEIRETIEIDNANKLTVLTFFMKKQFRKVIIIIIGVKTIQQMSGLAAIEAYMQYIIELTNSVIPGKYASIIFGAVQFPAALLSTFVVDKFGRKPLMIISSVGCALALIGEGIYFFLQDYLKVSVSFLDWLPMTGIVVYQIFSVIGIFNLPYILLGELFATNVKGIAVSGALFYGGLLGFVVSKLFNTIVEAWGMYTVFWIYAGFLVAGIFFTIFCLPETKNKTFKEIQNKINGNST